MKNSYQFLAILLLLFTISCDGSAQSYKQSNDQNSAVVQVIDFHSTSRCKTCLTIEKRSLELLTKEFADELEAGIVEFKAINIDEEPNFTIAEEFQVTGTSLFVNTIYQQESSKVDLTEFAFMRATIPDNSFDNRLSREIKKGLKKIGYGVAN